MYSQDCWLSVDTIEVVEAFQDDQDKWKSPRGKIVCHSKEYLPLTSGCNLKMRKKSFLIHALNWKFSLLLFGGSAAHICAVLTRNFD